MRTLAEQIQDVLTNSEAVENAGAEVRRTYCEQIARETIESKANLIEILSKHPNWDAQNYRVHFNKDFVRPGNRDQAAIYLSDAMDVIITYFREMLPRTADFPRTVIAKEDKVDEIRRKVRLYYIASFISNERRRFAVDSIDDQLFSLLHCQNYCIYLQAPENTLGCHAHEVKSSNDNSEFIWAVPERVDFSDACIHAGSKGTKQVMRLMRQYGFEDLPEDIKHSFLQSYSQFADNMNPITITRHTVLSVNPVDFLLMSNGNSWTSCHNIREGGCYCGGCESYAYDKVSMIFYTVDAETPDDKITNAPKINRQMNFFNGDALLSVRVYPQSCDGDTGIYNECKAIVQQILADSLGKPNLWREVAWTAVSRGLQYPDYEHFGPYKAFRLSDVAEEDRHVWIDERDRSVSSTPPINQETGASRLDIGSSTAICACCGSYLDNNDYPICDDCAGGDAEYCCICGERLDSDDAYHNGDGDVYCESCFYERYTYCHACDEVVDRDDAIWVDEGGGYYVCPNCYDNDYFTCDKCGRGYRYEESYCTADECLICECCRDDYYSECEHCGELYQNEDVLEVNGGEMYVCQDCLENNTEKYFQCDECGEWFTTDLKIALPDGRHVCDACGDKQEGGQVICHECGDRVRLDEAESVNNGDFYVCDDCVGTSKYFQCDSCGEWFTADMATDTADSIVCHKCLKENYQLQYVRKDGK